MSDSDSAPVPPACSELERELIRADRAREVAIVFLLLASALGVYALGGSEIASMLGGAACALVVPRAGTVTRAAIVIGGIGLSSLTQGCGGVPEHVRNDYAIEVMRCHSNERAIISREEEDTTLEQQENDLASERQRCNDALREIENGQVNEGSQVGS